MEPTKELRQAVKEYKAGKAEAFTTLYEESSKYVYTCIYKVMVGNDNAQDIINDIMQDTYVEISKYISQLEDEDKFLSWAGTIATRKCYAYLKKNKKYVLLNEEDTTFDNLADNENIIPEEVMQDREKQRLVREIIETQLTEMQKLCIIAYYYNEQKQSEIAEELGIPENTVKTNISRAKAKIKDGVLDLEKKQGTKLYSVAPFLLLLFKEEVQAAVVPKEVTEGIMSAVSAVTSAGAGVSAGAVTTKGIIGKIASASLKAKIIAGVVTVGVIGGVTGTVYVASHQTEEVIEEKVIPDGDIVFYAEEELGKYAEYGVNVNDYATIEKEFITEEEIPVYSVDGIKVGHTKIGVTINLSAKSQSIQWYRFENPVQGTDYEYLFINDEYLPESAKYRKEETKSAFEMGQVYTNGEIVLEYTGKEEEYFLDITYQKVEGGITTSSQVPVYCKDGYKIGYIKEGVTIDITEHGIDSAWYRFENPIDGTEFEYLYVFWLDPGIEMNDVRTVPGQVRTDDYSFEIKEKYDESEALCVFNEVLEHGGLVNSYDVIQNFYNVRDEDGNQIYMIFVDIPLENTVEWSEEKLKIFQEHSVDYFYTEGYSFSDYSEGIALWLAVDKSTALTKEEMEDFFNSEVDLEIKERKQKEYEEFLNNN